MKLLTTGELTYIHECLLRGMKINPERLEELSFTAMMYKKAYEDMQDTMNDLKDGFDILLSKNRPG